MASVDVLVDDIKTHQSISNASFDHPAINAGEGFYSVDLGLDSSFITSAPGYNATTSDIRSILWTGTVDLTPSGGGGSCF
jgi:hypothetical protein